MKPTSVPSRNLPKSSVKANSSPKISKRKIRLEKRLEKIKISEDKKIKEKEEREKEEREKEENSANNNVNEDENVDQMLTDENIYQEADEVQNSNKEKLMVDLGIQVNFNDNFYQLLKTDQQLSTATGIQSFALLGSIVKAVEIAVPHLKERGTVLNIRDRCLITFVKLKHNVSYTFCAYFFQQLI